MKTEWTTLLREQRQAQFAALSGATVSLVLPVSDRLVTDLVGRQLPSSLREIDIRAAAGSQLTVGVRLRSPSWLPRINVKLAIERQPDLPDSPILVLRLLSHGAFAALAGPAVRFLKGLPAWIEMDGEIVRVNLAELARQFGVADTLTYIRRAEITTRNGSIVVMIDAGVG